MNISKTETAPETVNLDFKISSERVHLRMRFACIARDGAGRIDWFTLHAENELEAMRAAYAYRFNKTPPGIRANANKPGAYLVTIQNGAPKS